MRTHAFLSTVSAVTALMIGAQLSADDANDDPVHDVDVAAPPRGYLGLAYGGTQELPGGLPYARGASIFAYPTTPAYKAGLRDGDVLVKVGITVIDFPPKELLTRTKEVIDALAPGAQVPIEVVRDGKVLAVTATLGTRPPRFDRIATREAWLRADAMETPAAHALAGMAKAATAETRVADTLARLRACEEKRDAFRLRDEVEAHVRPFESEQKARDLARDMMEPLGAFPHLRSMHVDPPRVAPAEVERLAQAASLEEMADRLGEQLEKAHRAMDQALAALTADDRQHLRDHLKDLGDRLSFTFEIDMDVSPEREAANLRTVDILKKVDMAAVGEALRLALATVDPSVLKHMATLAEASPRKADPVILAKDTPGGHVEFDGTGDDIHTNEVAFRFDLGGNDHYLDCGGSASLDMPIAVTVDWDGDDVYTATRDGCQGAGILGIGILVDHAGNDRYTAARWSQGCGLGGAGILIDQAGDDEYRIQNLGQGCGLRGLGYLCDVAGNDRYEAARGAQGIGLPGGIGVLLDMAGDDHYFVGGRDRSSYGTPGVFEGWGQGLGVGFRGSASGGIGLLHDMGGKDVYEAGNFAQGGGYFYGWGILIDEAGDDRYSGARYAQGFGCHQAVGTFIDRAGNDRYVTVDGAACGIAWDESTAFFHDEAGDDQYLVNGFSLAAAAENGFAIFMDDKGNDVYAQTPAVASDDSYHGGSSVAVFLDPSGKDRWVDGQGEAGRAGWRGEDAFFLTAPFGSLGAVLKKGNLFPAK